MSATSPCLTCGACCAFFRVSFYWGEVQSAGGIVPDNLTLQAAPHLSCMAGTEKAPTRCVALSGTIGEQVACTIYDNRSSTCRNFAMSGDNGIHNNDCDRARAAHNLPPLQIDISLANA